ncbi:MAG: hypothetical protein K2X27_10680 [Candidatus Obscuribacterales bacterium]|nr:hypothetical protein [Candidatus Obscuribacterales bacterium]
MNPEFEKIDSTVQKAEKVAGAVVDLMVEPSFNNLFQVAKGTADLASFTSSELLINQMMGGNIADAVTKGMGGAANDAAGKGIFGGDMGGLLKAMEKSIHDLNDKQHKIAEKALHEKDTQKVSEKHENGNPIETVVVEKRDGTTIKYEPSGVKITEAAEGYKKTEYPKEMDPDVASVEEFPNGAVLTERRDGTTLFKPKDSDVTYRYDKDGSGEILADGTQRLHKKDGREITITPDGTKTTRLKDGTEIVESPNGDRSVSKPDRVEKDGTKVYNKDDGTVVRETNDGKRITDYPADVNEKVQSVIQDKNGDITQINRDGSVCMITHEGTISVLNNDGSSTIIHANGDMDINNANGTTVHLDKNGDIVTSKKDGTVRTQHPDGSSETVDHNKNLIVENAHGDKLKVKADGELDYIKIKQADGSYKKIDFQKEESIQEKMVNNGLGWFVPGFPQS